MSFQQPHARPALGSALFLLTALAGVSIPAPARACLHRQFSIDELTRRASMIVEGSVTAVKCSWNDAGTQIYTHVALDVSAYYKGSGGRQLELALLGGIVNDTGMLVVGSPVFREEQSVLLFLSSRPETGFPIVGMAEGFFVLEKNGNAAEPNLRSQSITKARSAVIFEVSRVLDSVPRP